MAQTVLGIDMGSYSLKVAQVERSLGEFKLVGFYEMPLIAEAILTSEQAGAAALTKFIEENNIAFDTCVVSVPGRMASFRSLTLPFGNVKKIDQTLQFELETQIPFDLEDILFDYTVLSTSPLESKVLTAYLRTEDFKRFLGEVKNSGVDPRYMGIDTMDLSYLTALGTLPPEGRYAILDLGHTKSNFIVLEKNKIKTLRCFSWGGHQLTQVIAKSAQLSYDQAETFKHSKGQLIQGSDDNVMAAIHRCFQDLMQQIRQTLFSYYESGEQPIEAVYLCGGTSRLPGIETFFSSQLNINVSQLDVLDDSFTEILDRERVRNVIPSALAAAMRAIYPSKGVKINFRRGEYAYTKDIEQMGSSLRQMGLLAASVAGLGFIYYIVSYLFLSSQVSKLNADIQKLVTTSLKGTKVTAKSASSVLTLLDSKIVEMTEKLKKVQGEGSLSSLKILKIISEALPPRDQLTVDIENINISPDRVRLDGRTISYEGVDKVKAALEKVKDFKNVQTGNVRKGIRDEIRFSLSFDVVG